MKVSVSVTAYNHEKYIAQCIDGILGQQTDFDFEILLGEDDSKDNTRAICQAYKDKYPDKISLFLNSRENVIYIKGRPTGRYNFLNNLRNARGEYVALCDGDDFWSDPHKLQRQVDYLDAHPEIAIHCTNARFLNESTGVERINEDHFKEGNYSLEDLLKGNFIFTCTAVFRRQLFPDPPAWFEQVYAGDYAMFSYIARQGNIHYSQKITCTYREHPGGNWTGIQQLERQERVAETYEIIRSVIDKKYHPKINERLYGYYYQISNAYMAIGDHRKARAYYRKLIGLSREHRFDIKLISLLFKIIFADLFKSSRNKNENN